MAWATQKKKRRELPAGVNCRLCGRLSEVLGLELSPQDPALCDPLLLQSAEELLSDPTKPCLPVGFEVESVSYCASHKADLLQVAGMTEKQKPVALFLANFVDENKWLMLTVRGGRKQKEPRLIKVGEDHFLSILQSIYVTEPNHACHLHPFMSSILHAFNRLCSETNMSFKYTDDVQEAVEKKRLSILVLPASDEDSESLFHKLAIETLRPSAEEIALHVAEWTSLASKTLDCEELLDKLSHLTTSVLSLTKAVPATSLQKSVAPKPNKRVFVEVDDPPAKASKKFVSNAMEASSKEDDREARNTDKFERRLKRIKEDSDEDSESGKKTSHKRNKREKSISESSLSSDSDGSGSDQDSEESNTEESEVKSQESDIVAKRHVDGFPVARRDRENTVLEATSVLDTVDACTAVSLASTPEAAKISASLRDKLETFKKNEFASSSEAALHNDWASMCATLVNALNATRTPEQIGVDANTTRKLAVSTFSALANFMPVLANMQANLDSAATTVAEFRRTTGCIVDNFHNITL